MYIQGFEPSGVIDKDAPKIDPRQALITLMNNSREAAGEAIFNSIFEAAPSLQVMFLGTNLLDH